MTQRRRNEIPRRKLLLTAAQGIGGSSLAAAAFPAIVPASVLGATAPSKRINVGAIGNGRISRGHDLPGVWKHDTARIVAVCDLDRRRTGDAQAAGHGRRGGGGGRARGGGRGGPVRRGPRVARPARFPAVVDVDGGLGVFDAPRVNDYYGRKAGKAFDGVTGYLDYRETPSNALPA